jgi:hypothetical protein
VKIYGPYARKADGRRIIVIQRDDGSKTSQSYARYLMEQKLGRKLDPNTETIDHIDRDKTNDVVENFAIKPRARHGREDAVLVEKVPISCVWCDGNCDKLARKLDSNAKQRKAGPFCSKQCAGCYGAHVRLGGNKLPVQPRHVREDRIYSKLPLWAKSK